MRVAVAAPARQGLVRPAAQRWAVVAALLVLLLGMTEATFAEMTRRPLLGPRAERRGEHLVVTWLQPAGFAWDAGVRPGDVVLEIDGGPVSAMTDPAAVWAADRLAVRLADGRVVAVSAESALPGS
ncbi:MAG: PDZ domain-containing protein, partial [Chloroflexota bacterium]|nr:PDZ domain-containing protein [Chloroflexota bacterium]